MKKRLFVFSLVIISVWLCLPLVSWAGHNVGVATLRPTGADPDASGVALIMTTSDGRVIVNALVVGMEPGLHETDIHKGSCAKLGAHVYNLLDTPVDRSGHGGQMTILQLQLGQLKDLISSPHSVTLHEFSTEGGIGGLITCGDITYIQLP